MKQRKQYNLTPFERNLLRKLKENEDLKVVMIDKNMGTGLMPKSLYIQRAWSDHLSNSMTYREISAGAIPAEIGRIKYLVDTFLSKCHKELPNHERVFLRRLRAEFYTSLISKFYIMPKLHKTPWKTRPVVPTCGTILHGISRWAHYHLWKLIHLIPSYIKDCIDVKEKLEALGPLPPGTRVFTMDAQAMYTNINFKHGSTSLNSFCICSKTNYQLTFQSNYSLKQYPLSQKTIYLNLGTTTSSNLWVKQWEPPMQQ